MTTLTADNTKAQAKAAPLLTPWGWVWVAVVSALFVGLFHHVIVRILRVATNAPGDDLLEVLVGIFNSFFNGKSWNPDWSHALVLPFISVYYVYSKRHHLAATPMRVYWPGLVVLLFGLGSYIFWVYPGRNDMIQGYSMIICALGVVLFLLGPRALAILWFPVVYIGFGIKVSDRIWTDIAAHLQFIAANSATIVLNLVGIGAEVEGNTISLYDGFTKIGDLNVAEACSGLRMLMAFLALGVAMAFLVERRWWQRLIMCLFTVPIAVAVNVGRVTILGMLYLVDPEMATGQFHTMIGMFMLIPAALLFLLLGWVLDKIIIEDGTGTKAAPPTPQLTATDKLQSLDPRRTPKVTIGSTLVGISLMLLMGVAYAAGLAWMRPDLLLEWESLPQGVMLAMPVLAVGLFLAAWGVVWWWAKRPIPNRSMVGLGVCVGIFLTTLLGQNAVLAMTKAVLIKEAVPLRTHLFLLPDQVGLWEMVYDEKMTDEILEVLGTRDYVSRAYINKGAPKNSPESVLQFHVAYYTGTADTVPHVPETCYVAGGLEYVGLTVEPMNLDASTYTPEGEGYLSETLLEPGTAYLPHAEFDVTRFTFARTDGGARRLSNVFYFFVVNGKYLPTPDHVRLQGFDPRDKHSYYCKVEVGLPHMEDVEQAREIAEGFLRKMLPEVMACLPDWREVKAGTYPTEDTPGGS